MTSGGWREPSFAWNADSTILAVADGETIKLWPVRDEQETRHLHAGSEVTDVSWHPVAGVACSTMRGVVSWWPEEAKGERREDWFPTGRLGGAADRLAWQPAGEWLAIASRHGLFITDP